MGGSSNTTTRVPKWQEDAAIAALDKANRVSNIPYAPYYGPDVAAISPQQVAAMQNTNQAASAFGTPTADPMAGLPPAQNFNGVQAYSSGGLYDLALAELKARNPEIYAAIVAQFDPAGAGNAPAASVPTPEVRKKRSSSSGSSNQMPTPTSSGGGYTSLRDMFDGGGAGTSGSTFSGNPLSNILNRVGVAPRAAAPVSAPVARPAPRPAPRPVVVTRPKPAPHSTRF